MRTTVAALVVLLLPAMAQGQAKVSSFEALNTVVKPGDTVVVTDTGGAN